MLNLVDSIATLLIGDCLLRIWKT